MITQIMTICFVRCDKNKQPRKNKIGEYIWENGLRIDGDKENAIIIDKNVKIVENVYDAHEFSITEPYILLGNLKIK